MSALVILIILFELISAAVFAYAVAVSKGDSKKIVKLILIGTVIYILATIISFRLAVLFVIQSVITIAVFLIVFCILGGQTGNKFNLFGLISLFAYVASLFALPVISNKYEDSIGFQFIEGLMNEMGLSLSPKQFEILKYAYSLTDENEDIRNYCLAMQIMFIGVALFAILVFYMILLRKNEAQMVMGGIMSFFAAGIIYLDYCIFHSDSLKGMLVNIALEKAGFSLSPFCALIMAFALGTVISAKICNKKEVK